MGDWISPRTLELSENKTEGDLFCDKHTIKNHKVHQRNTNLLLQIQKNQKALLSRAPLFASEIWQPASENHHVHKSASSTHGPHLLALVLGHFEGYLRGEEDSFLREKHGGSSRGTEIGPHRLKDVNKLQLDEWNLPDVQNLSCLLYVMASVCVSVCRGVSVPDD